MHKFLKYLHLKKNRDESSQMISKLILLLKGTSVLFSSILSYSKKLKLNCSIKIVNFFKKCSNLSKAF